MVLKKAGTHVQKNENRSRSLNLNKKQFNSKWSKDLSVRCASSKLLERDREHVQREMQEALEKTSTAWEITARTTSGTVVPGYSASQHSVGRQRPESRREFGAGLTHTVKPTLVMAVR